MKKLTLKQRQRFRVKSRKKKGTRFSTIAFRNGVKLLDIDRSKVTVRVKAEKRRLIVDAPENFNFSENYEQIIHFIGILRRAASNRFHGLYINFTTLRTMSPLGALVLTSEVDRWQILRGKLTCQDTDKWSPEIKSLLVQMGFFDLIDANNKFEMPEVETSKKYISFISGTKNEGKLAHDLAQSIKKIAGEIGMDKLLYKGLTEAMQNAIEWAYRNLPELPDKLRKYWMSASYDTVARTVTVMIYDHGTGIPSTLPASDIWDRCSRVLAKWNLTDTNDADLIKAAMVAGRSASKSAHRGKGLKDIQQFIRASKEGKLRIMSGKGEYLISHEGVEETRVHKRAIKGTLIAWNIRVGNDDV